jgi:putative transposase
MLKLEDIIDAKEGREIKRALAAKMVSEGFERSAICKLLDVSDSFISKWKNIYEDKGAEGLLLNHKGSQSFLTLAQKNEVIVYLRNLSHFSVEELRDYIESTHGVIYKSKQSYYDLFDEAGISWHKSQKVNPKRDEKKILAKREDIKKTQRA